MIIDSHQHFWRLERGDYGWITQHLAPIFRDFGPGDLRPLLDAHSIDATIAVQAAPTWAETAFLLDLAQQSPWVLGVVGWMDIEAETAAADIERVAEQHPRLLGLRPMIQDISDDAWMLQDRLRPAIEAMEAADLTFDALVLPKHLEPLKTFLSRFSSLRVMVDHGAKPEIRNQGFEPWASDIAAVATHSNAWCKLSGLLTEARTDQDADDLAPYVQHILDVFGPERCLWGSDWPVLTMAAGYGAWFEMLNGLTQSLIEDQRRGLMGENAVAAYPRLAYGLEPFNAHKSGTP